MEVVFKKNWRGEDCILGITEETEEVLKQRQWNGGDFYSQMEAVL